MGIRAPAFRGIPKENGVSISRLKLCISFLANEAMWATEPRRSGAFLRRTASPSHASSSASPFCQRRPHGHQSSGVPGAFPRRTASPSHASSPASPSWQRRPRGHQSFVVPGAFPRRTASPSHASSPASPSWQRRPRGHQSPGVPGHSQGERRLRLTPQAQLCIAFLAKAATCTVNVGFIRFKYVVLAKY